MLRNPVALNVLSEYKYCEAKSFRLGRPKKITCRKHHTGNGHVLRRRIFRQTRFHQRIQCDIYQVYLSSGFKPVVNNGNSIHTV